jgi:hypothetical protein
MIHHTGLTALYRYATNHDYLHLSQLPTYREDDMAEEQAMQIGDPPFQPGSPTFEPTCRILH